jgi:hypothetical protein
VQRERTSIAAKLGDHERGPHSMLD